VSAANSGFRVRCLSGKTNQTQYAVDSARYFAARTPRAEHRFPIRASPQKREFVPQNLQGFGHPRQFVSRQKAHDEAWPRQISDPACNSGRPDSADKDSLKGVAGSNSPSRSDFLRHQVSASHYCPPVSTPSKQVSRSVDRSGADRTLDRDGAAQE